MNTQTPKYFAAALALTTLIFGEGLQAATFKCRVQHHHEGPTTTTADLICGEFNFDTSRKETKNQSFEKCGGMAVSYRSLQIPEGPESVVEIGSSNGNKGESTSFGAKVLPAKFNLERSFHQSGKNQKLIDQDRVECHQSEVTTASITTRDQCADAGGEWGPWSKGAAATDTQTCRIRAKDAGHACKDGHDCSTKLCEYNETTKAAACTAYDSVAGCHAWMKDGKPEPALCVD